MKLCTDCRHCDRRFYTLAENEMEVFYCGRLASPVDGKSITSCRDEREAGWFWKRCGPNAEFWEAKIPLDPSTR